MLKKVVRLASAMECADGDMTLMVEFSRGKK